MKLDIDNLNPGTWFDFPDNEGRICLRIMPYEASQSIVQQITKKKVEYKHGQRFPVEETNDDLAFDLTWEYCIVDWEKLFSADGQEIPCTKEMKLKLMRKSPTFADFIADCIRKLRDAELKALEDSEKN